MCQRTHLTVGELSRIFDLPSWKIRRLVDSIGIEMPRAGGYRLILRELIPTIAAELHRRGWLPSPTGLQNADADELVQAGRAPRSQQGVPTP